MLRGFILLLSILLTYSVTTAQEQIALIYGKVINSQTEQPLEDCNIIITGTDTGTVTNEQGEFSLLLPFGNYEIKFSYIGFKSVLREVELTKKNHSQYISILLNPESFTEDEIIVKGEKEENTTEMQVMDAKDIQLMPNVYNDVLRSVQVMAGVATNNELTTGYNVRGGSFDENLIYLNGFEIYRPFLVKQGIEENQSLINPDMITGMKFYNGEFSARFGDRMSSALEVNYESNFENKFTGTIRADLLNTGVNLSRKIDNLNVSLGVRYSYPDAFLNSLQTTGDYIPSFSDVQILSDYKFSDKSKLELLGIYAVNKFFLEPERWDGTFGGFHRGDYRALIINYDGRNEFKYTTNLIGLRYSHFINNSLSLKLSVSRYATVENEKRNTSGELLYNPDARNDNPNLYEFIKTRYEFADNKIDLSSFRIKTEAEYNYKVHTLSSGLEYRFVDFNNHIDEMFYEKGEETFLQVPEERTGDDFKELNSFSAYVMYETRLSDRLKFNIGLRFLRYDYSNENLFSPRMSVNYTLNPLTKFSFAWGYYYQPPFVNELKNPELSNLKSQRAIHYAFGWEQQLKEKLKLTAEAYFKDLDNLIPFYFDELKMIYVDGNSREGYSYGLDIQLDGELVEGMRSLIGYGYLNSMERNYGEAEYNRRLLDQTHTIQIFLQDRIKKHPNWQSHLRFLFGSGLLYYSRIGEIDEETGKKSIVVNTNYPLEYFLYFRVDMGLSASFDIFNDYKLVAVAEVLNVFNHLNYGSYDWVEVFEEFNAPYRIPRVLSRRFFNIRFELRF